MCVYYNLSSSVERSRFVIFVYSNTTPLFFLMPILVLSVMFGDEPVNVHVCVSLLLGDSMLEFCAYVYVVLGGLQMCLGPAIRWSSGTVIFSKPKDPRMWQSLPKPLNIGFM